MADPAQDDAKRLLAVLHDILVVLLLVLRPLCWDGQPGQAADLLWQALAAGALLIAGIERAAGLEPWRWTWRGLAGLALVAALLPAALTAPESAAAWCRWTGWAACAASGIYLAQVAAGRLRLMAAALLSALAVEALLAVAQRAWVMPAMASAQSSGSAMFAAFADRGDFAERIARGGVFATFTLGNQLGAWLALLLPLAAGMAAAGRGAVRWAAIAIGGVGLAAVAFANAKGALLALGVAAAVGWWAAFPGRWWRWLPLPGAVIGIVLLVASHAADASIRVRAGYWQAAVALVREAPLAGHGLGGFAAHYPRLMRPGDEPTMFAHNEVLEAAVAGGAWLGLAVLALLAAWAWPRRPAAEAEPEREIHPAVPWVLVVMLPYIALFGALDGNLGWWPGVVGVAGGAAMGAKLTWALLLGAVAAGICTALRRAPTIPGWAWAGALATVLVGPLIDFDLHAAGYVGGIVAVACAMPSAARIAPGIGLRVAGLALAMAIAAAWLSSLATGRRLVEAEETLFLLDASRRDPQAARELGQRFAGDPTERPVEMVQRILDHAWRQAEGAPRIRLNVLQLSPPGDEALARAGDLAREAPASAAVALHHAGRLAGARRWDEAAAEAVRAVDLAPTAPRMLVNAAAILDQAAAQRPLEGYAARAAALRADAARLQPLVDAKLRTPDPLPMPP